MNTIYDGTYVIGQTSATNFQAGPGISITQPSEGTVRIANDETLLYSGNTQTTSFALTESPSAFERLKIRFDEMGNGNRIGLMWCNDTSLSTIGAVGLNFLTNDSSDGIHINAARFVINSTGMTMNYSHKKWLALAPTASQNVGDANTISDTVIYEIYGINRISGGNE